MRLPAYILAFYLIVLAALPCCAFDNCADEKMEQAGTHEKGDEDCGTCSPFFNCEGCAAASIAYEPAQFDFAIDKIAAVYTGYRQLSLPETNIEFWQPPKLG